MTFPLIKEYITNNNNNNIKKNRLTHLQVFPEWTVAQQLLYHITPAIWNFLFTIYDKAWVMRKKKKNEKKSKSGVHRFGAIN